MYRCSNCGATMSYPKDICPQCGVLLSGVKCEGCGHIDSKTVFINNNHRCPECGSLVTISDEGSGKGCFVATVVFDNYDCPEVAKLRNFRDHYLVKTALGRKFIVFYNKNGPKWACAINDKPLIKSFLKCLFKLFL